MSTDVRWVGFHPLEATLWLGSEKPEYLNSDLRLKLPA